MCLGRDILAVGAVRACRLAILPEPRIEPQPVERPEAFVTFGEGVDVQLGRPEAVAGGLIEDCAHPRREISAGGILGLPRPVVDVSGIVDRRNFLDRGAAGGDVAVFGRFLPAVRRSQLWL